MSSRRIRGNRTPFRSWAPAVVFGVGLAAVCPLGAVEPGDAAADAMKKVNAYQTREARAALEPVAGKAESDPRVALALGRVLDQEKKFDEAAAMLKKAAEKAPSDPAAHVYLGETYLHANRQSDADGEFRKAAEFGKLCAEKDPKDAASRYFLGVANQRLKNYDEALAQLEKARELQPDNALATYQIGVTKVFQQKWAEGVDQLGKALEKDSGIAYAYYYRGLAQDKLGRKDQMVLDLDRFVKLAPDAPEADRARTVLKAAKR